MDVGKRIVEFREKAGITTNKLAYICGLSQSFLRSVELGEKNISVNNLSIICNALNITMYDFFNTGSEISTDDNLLVIIENLNHNQRSALRQFLLSMLTSQS